ncbi:DUF998 domain-containing protein [Paenibacillus sp. 1P07SE]|uniref:DUF998 domain-containing protein n=1 Tax=Paenibacillus sp. 1P07SE TaxID=3132209 RepID=UPI0039A6B63B
MIIPAAYLLMAGLSLAALVVLVVIQRRQRLASFIGRISWIAISFYFVAEYVVTRATTAPFDPLQQPMSDLGVTVCGEHAYLLADYAICSPMHLTINWAFTLAGLTTIAGALSLRYWLPSLKKTRAAAVLWIIYGLSNIAAGIVPADIDFWIHTLGSLPSMIVQIPALILIALTLRKDRPWLALWTWASAAVTTASLLLLFVQLGPIDLSGGLLQRVLYASVYLWMSVTAIVLWRTDGQHKAG